MAELEFAGLKFKGGKIVVVITALGTLLGGAWGAFEFYKDYLTMKQTISEYVAPDLSGFDKRIDLVQQEVEMLQGEMSMILEEVGLVADVAKELKNDLKGDVRRIEKIVNDVEQMVKEDSRETSSELKDTTRDMKEDMELLSGKLEQAMTEFEEKVDKQIKKALENPLNSMK